MIDFSGFSRNYGQMAEGGGSRKMKAGKAVEAADLPIPIDLPPAMFTGPGLITLPTCSL